MTTLARLASFAAALLYATADGIGAFGRSLVAAMEGCPDVLPEFVDDGSAES